MPYCMYQSFNLAGKTPNIIFGIGTTETAARADAVKWAELEECKNE